MKSFETKKENKIYLLSIFWNWLRKKFEKNLCASAAQSLLSCTLLSQGTRSWRSHENVQKTSSQPTRLIIFQNSIPAKWTSGFIHSNSFLAHWLEEESFWQKKGPMVWAWHDNPVLIKRTEAGNKQGEAGDVYLALSFQGPSPPDAIPLSPRPLSSHLSAPHCPQLAACFTHSFHKHICLGLRSTWHCLNYLL